MPTLILKDLPKPLYESLQRRAMARHRSVPDETVYLLQQALGNLEASAPEVDASQEINSEDIDASEEDRPWRGVFVLPRPRDILFVRAAETEPLPKRPLALNLAWHRAEADDV